MARQYEFLIAGLPDLHLDENKSAFTFKAFMAEIAECVEEPDASVADAMRLPIDNRNLINLLEEKGDFDDNGSLSREELDEFIKSPGTVQNFIPNFSLNIPDRPPKYMQKFMVAHRENRQLFPGLTPYDQLTWLFYEEMAESKNEFIRDWYEFDQNLRNVMAAINIRKGLTHIEAIGTERDRPGVFTIIGRSDVAEALLKSATPDFGLMGGHPWMEKVIALGRGSLTDMEKGLDDIRWEMLSDMTIDKYFDIEMIASVAQKLLIVERWMRLDPVAGREKLDKLVEEMMGSFVMPAGF